MTIVLDDSIGLQRTRASLQSQRDRNFQWIVVDGGSAEPTKALLESLAEAGEASIIVGPDNGPYDGMNKGAQQARADWVLFLNSGDELCDSDTLVQLGQFLLESDTAVLYGDYERVAFDGSARIKLARPLGDLRYSMPFCHQSVLTRRDILLSRPFEQTIAADWRFLNDCFHAGLRLRHIDLRIARFHEGGLSNKFWIASWIDRVRHLKQRGRLSGEIGLWLFLNLCKHLCKREG